MINLHRLPPKLPRIHPKQSLAGPDSLLRIPIQSPLLLRPLLFKRQPPIAMVRAMRRQLRDLRVVVGIYLGDVPGQAVAHDEELSVGGEPDGRDAGVQCQEVFVVLVEDEAAEGDGGALEGGFGVACGGVEGGAGRGPAGVGPGCPLEVLEGYSEGEAGRGGGAVVEDLLGCGGVGCQDGVGAAEGGGVEGVVGVGAAFVGGGRGGVEGAGGVGGDLGVGGVDLVEDCEAVLG